MKRYFHRPPVFLLLCSLFFLPDAVDAQDKRTSPIDAFLLIDATEAMDPVRGEALEWVCSKIVDGILQEGDRISVLSVAEKPSQLVSQTISAGAQKNSLKDAIRGMQRYPGSADYRAALAIAESEERGRSDRDRIFFALLVGVFFDESSAAREKADYTGMELLKYSRIEDFPGWKAVVVGLNMDGSVNRATELFKGQMAASPEERVR